MNVHTHLTLPVLVMPFTAHNQLKHSLLESISVQSSEVTEKNNTHEVLRTDYPTGKLQSSTDRSTFLYKTMIMPFLKTDMDRAFKVLNHDNPELLGMWFQQYNTKGHHDWHQHRGSTWSCVYYLELAQDGPPTVLRDILNPNKEWAPKVKEGDILIFPSFVTHCSPPNTGNSRKTVIAFNIK